MAEEILWQCADQQLSCGQKTIIVGVLNVTPDSFSDGGRYVNPQDAAEHARQMWQDGAQIIDIGGESTRPGSQPVSLQEELDRVLPVVEAVRQNCDRVLLSVDTTKAEVARCVLLAGATIINDITALTGDPEMLDVATDSDCGLVLMHMQGQPLNMQQCPHYENVVDEVEAFFKQHVDIALQAGIDARRICLDPGIGFGKSVEDNLALIAAAGRFRKLGFPIYYGLSRKSFLGSILDDAPVEQRLEASLAANVGAVLAGADIVRVHDVAETSRALAVADRMRQK